MAPFDTTTLRILIIHALARNEGAVRRKTIEDKGLRPPC